MTTEYFVSEMESAMRSINRGNGITAREGGTKAENRYADAYSELVKAGVYPRLKRRYRTGRSMKITRR